MIFTETESRAKVHGQGRERLRSESRQACSDTGGLYLETLRDRWSLAIPYYAGICQQVDLRRSNCGGEEDRQVYLLPTAVTLLRAGTAKPCIICILLSVMRKNLNRRTRSFCLSVLITYVSGCSPKHMPDPQASVSCAQSEYRMARLCSPNLLSD